MATTQQSRNSRPDSLPRSRPQTIAAENLESCLFLHALIRQTTLLGHPSSKHPKHPIGTLRVDPLQCFRKFGR
jgi:hypothetical protein